jgi:hypothetical protein
MVVALSKLHRPNSPDQPGSSKHAQLCIFAFAFNALPTSSCFLVFLLHMGTGYRHRAAIRDRLGMPGLPLPVLLSAAEEEKPRTERRAEKQYDLPMLAGGWNSVAVFFFCGWGNMHVFLSGSLGWWGTFWRDVWWLDARPFSPCCGRGNVDLPSEMPGALELEPGLACRKTFY